MTNAGIAISTVTGKEICKFDGRQSLNGASIFDFLSETSVA